MAHNLPTLLRQYSENVANQSIPLGKLAYGPVDNCSCVMLVERAHVAPAAAICFAKLDVPLGASVTAETAMIAATAE